MSLINTTYYSTPFYLLSSNPYPDSTSRECDDIFGDCNSLTIDDSLTDDCSGDKTPDFHSFSDVRNISVNATSIQPSETINISVQFDEFNSGTNYEWLFYYNGSTWMNLTNWTADGCGAIDCRIENRSFVFTPNSTTGTHIVRAILSMTADDGFDGCADTDPVYDNDDVNFWVNEPQPENTSLGTLNQNEQATVNLTVNLTEANTVRE